MVYLSESPHIENSSQIRDFAVEFCKAKIDLPHKILVWPFSFMTDVSGKMLAFADEKVIKTSSHYHKVYELVLA